MTPAHPSPAAARDGVAVGAFFDVDNTLVPGSAVEVRFFAYLLRHRIVGLREMLHSLRVLARRPFPTSLHPLREHKAYLTGKRADVIQPLAAWFIRATICQRLSPAGLAALTRHQEAGHHVVLITASPDFLVAPLAAFLGVGDVLAARPEHRNGTFTGRLIPPLPYGEGKRELLERFADERGLDLAHSYAYGDSPGDVHALRMVGHPLVVNPIRGMARIARRQGWPVARWRLKD